MGARTNDLITILCIAVAIYELIVNDSLVSPICLFIFALGYIICYYLISKAHKQKSFSYLGNDISCVISLLIILYSLFSFVMLLIDSLNDILVTSNVTLSLLLIIFSLLSFYLNYKTSKAYRHIIPTIHKKMKAILVKQFGEVDDILELATDHELEPRMLLEDEMVIKVLSVSLSPSDYRMWSGAASMVKYPPWGFPYVPLGDVCGIVVQTNDKYDHSNKFKVGDYIVATWNEFGINCLAEYAIVSTKFATLLPTNDNNNSYQNSNCITTEDTINACALANTSIIAYDTVLGADIQPNDRILVIGASGGMGTAMIQFIRNTQPNAYIAGVSTDEHLLLNVLKVDRHIDYTKENWWEMDEFQKEPFDKIFDCAEGAKGFNKANEFKVIKSASNGGKWIAVVINDWHINGQNFGGLMCGFAWPMLKRIILNKFRGDSEAEYIPTFPNVSAEKLDNILRMHGKKEFEVVLDPQSPFEFTLEGVKEAFKKHQNRKGHGKIVIKVADV